MISSASEIEAGNLLKGTSIGANEFTLSVYPSSMPVYMDLSRKGTLANLAASGAIIKTAFCEPCFGACQRVIGALANITQDYARKRYRSNVMNWGMLPFHLKGQPDAFEVGDWIYVPGIGSALRNG